MNEVLYCYMPSLDPCFTSRHTTLFDLQETPTVIQFNVTIISNCDVRLKASSFVIKADPIWWHMSKKESGMMKIITVTRKAVYEKVKLLKDI